MIGRCFCGQVAFEFDGPMTEIELCHCTRCQRSTGSAFAAQLRVRAERFRWLRGEDRIAFFDAPILNERPAYRRSFCSACGAAVPSIFAGNPTVAIPAGLVEGALPVRAADQIWVEKRASWLDLRAIAGLPEHSGDPSAESNARLLEPLGLGR
ncbi:MAG TPA: GFA family protein [Myxococcota bacterium]|nr:GFA family protein [Myxococcota bacterium]